VAALGRVLPSPLTMGQASPTPLQTAAPGLSHTPSGIHACAPWAPAA